MSPDRSISGPFASPSSPPSSSSSSPSRREAGGGQHRDARLPASRERGDPMEHSLFTMIGENAPTLVVNRDRSRKGTSASTSSKREPAARWQLKPFRNPARKDKLELSHWEPLARTPKADPLLGPNAQLQLGADADAPNAEAAADSASPYPFARYNTTSNIYEYTDDEYAQHLRDPTGDWSREETDHLFSLCHAYDLRWFVIKDRWEWPSGGANSRSESARTQAQAQAQKLAGSQSTEAVLASSGAQASADGATISADSDLRRTEEPESGTPAAKEGIPEAKQEGGGSVPLTGGMASTVPANGDAGGAAPAPAPTPATASATATAAAASAPPAFSPKRERSIEELKDRYYAVCRLLIRARPAGDEAARAVLLQSYLFEKDRESARKAHLEKVLTQLTPAQIAEEEFLYIESRRLEQTYTKTARERDELWRLLGGMAPQSTSNLALTASFLSPAAHAIAANAAGLAGLNVGNSSKKRRRGELDMLEDPTGTANKLGGSGISAQAAVPQFTPEQDAALGITRYDSLGPASSIMRPAGVYLRSSKPPALKTSLAPRIQAVLAEQKINMRLAMPTRANMERLEALVQTITALLDCKKQVERAEGELKMLKIRKGAALRVEEADRLQAQEAQGDEGASSQGQAAASQSATPMPEQSSRASSMQVDG